MSYRQVFEKISMYGLSAYPLGFLGKYPTRIYLSAATGTYRGKPTPEAFEWARRNLVFKNTPTRIQFIEYDQNGLIQNLVNGNYGKSISSDWYHPMPSNLIHSCGHRGRLFLMMVRKRIAVEGREIWVIPCLFNKTEICEPYVRLVKECVRGRIRQRIMTEQQELDLIPQVEEEAVKWATRPELPRPQTPPNPPQPEPWFRMEDGVPVPAGPPPEPPAWAATPNQAMAYQITFNTTNPIEPPEEPHW